MIKLIVFDFDGVFTDGKFYFDNNSNTKKCYNGKDAYALKILKNHNIKTGVITNDPVVSIEYAPHIFSRLDKVSLGSERPKLDILDEWLLEYGYSYKDIAYIGDDLPDVPVLQKVGLSGCPIDAVDEVKQVSKYICKNKGGEGAVREFVDYMIRGLNSSKKNVCFCIPARFNSSRLDQKLLLPLGNKSCIQRCVSSLYESRYYDNNIYVFTDSSEISHNLENYECNVILTKGEFSNGTERIAKNLDKIDSKYNIIVNIQGDEPFISHKNVDFCIDKHMENCDPDVFYTTLHETDNKNEYLESSASLKLTIDNNNNVIYYSRNIIPSNKNNKINDNIKYNTFTGIYVYDKNRIIEYGDLDNTFLQREEDCEQLKVIENGYKIKSFKTIEYNEISLNTGDDYKYLCDKYCNNAKYIMLDCTLRDGGYINNWKFSKSFLTDYVNLMNSITVDFVEIGFINKTIEYKGNIVGPCRNINKEYLDLFKNTNFKISVMGDYQDINMTLLEDKSNLQIIDLVRVAFHIHDLEKAINVCIKIKNLGYKVSVNAMAITNYSERDLETLFNLVNHNSLDILYIADSYGSLNNSEIKDYIGKFENRLCNTSVGIHLHNNMNNAFSNFLASQDILTNKPLYIDSTLFGMGRGAGNLATELVINYNDLDTQLIIETLLFIDKHIYPLFNNNTNTNWGYDLDYFLSGILKIHPNYINKFRQIDITLSKKILLLSRIIDDNKHTMFSLEYVNSLIKEYNDFLLN